MCSYATAAVTLPGAQQPRLAPVLPPRLRQAVTAGLRSARVTGALTLPGAQQSRLAPVLPPRLRQAVTAELRSARVRAETNQRRALLAGDVHVQLRLEQLQARV